MKLDKHQQAAAESEALRNIVVSAPGSGKTRTVCARYTHMVETQGILPSQIVLLTFTRYAANEMRERLGDSARGSYIGTFHAFALQIIRQYGERRGWATDWLCINDDLDVKFDEEEALRASGVKTSGGSWCAGNAGAWSRHKLLRSCGDWDADAPDIGHDERLSARAYDLLCERLNAENCLTFGMLIPEAIELLRDPEVLASVRQRYKHIIADEVQDSNTNQWRLIDSMQPLSVFVVGDPRQSIYEWNGGRPDLMVTWSRSSRLYHLPFSYRFGVSLADAANKLMSHGQSSEIDRAIQALDSRESNLDVTWGAESSGIVGMIADQVQAGFGFGDIAVLARKHSILDELADSLRQSGLPVNRVGGDTDITKSTEYRVLLSYLRLSVNPMDRRSFMNIAPIERLSGADVLDIRERAVRNDISYVEAMAVNLPHTLSGIIERIAGHGHDVPVFTMAAEYMENVRIRESITDNAELVQLLCMQSDQDKLAANKDGLPLLTVHASKGLEWPVVFVVGMNEGDFPSKMSVRDNRLDEERRLFYVAMTRAEKRLVVVNHAARKRDDRPSRFLTEMGASEDLQLV